MRSNFRTIWAESFVCAGGFVRDSNLTILKCSVEKNMVMNDVDFEAFTEL